MTDETPWYGCRYGPPSGSTRPGSIASAVEEGGDATDLAHRMPNHADRITHATLTSQTNIANGEPVANVTRRTASGGVQLPIDTMALAHGRHRLVLKIDRDDRGDAFRRLAHRLRRRERRLDGLTPQRSAGDAKSAAELGRRPRGVPRRRDQKALELPAL